MLNSVLRVIRILQCVPELCKRRFTLRARPQRRICFRNLHLQYTNTAAFDFFASAPLGTREISGLSRSWIFFIVMFTCLSVCLQPALAGHEERPGTAVLKVRGYGFRGNRRLRRSIEMLDTVEERTHYDAAFIEDAAFIMLSMVKQDGYLDPTIQTELVLKDGAEKSYQWRTGADIMLPRPSDAVEVRFTVDAGVLFYYEEIHIFGLRQLDMKEARAYFIPTDFLISLKRTKTFTPGKLNRSISNLQDALARKGYKNARVMAKEVEMERETGAVTVGIQVEEGKKHLVGRVREKILYEDREEDVQDVSEHAAVPFTRAWLQDTTIELRNRFLRKGYADTDIDVRTKTEQKDGEKIRVDLLFLVETGPKIYLDEIIFQGAEKTRQSVLRRRVKVGEGEALDRLELEHARYRLARLGVFDSVELSYEDVDPDRRKAIFKLKEGKEIEASLMLGYGSYELLRGGIELAQYNIFGLAHRSRLQLAQSFKSTGADYTYTMPDFFRRNIDAFTNVSALRRRELDFVREEYGGSAGLRTYSRPIDSDLSFRYSYQSVESKRFEGVEQYGMKRAMVGSLIFDITQDRRDNPLSPRSGLKLSGAVEMASQVFMGDANYQQLNLGSSWHRGVGRGVYFNLGFKHGLTNSSGRARNNLPFNKRFFPGGDNSVRGYQYGGAAPKDEDKKLIGAETYTLLNLELEQIMTPSWSLVLFADGLAMAQSIRNYPYDETLYSLGGGLRYSTFMGPLRVEYGHNPSPRSGDPTGTLHISLGFPF